MQALGQHHVKARIVDEDDRPGTLLDGQFDDSPKEPQEEGDVFQAFPEADEAQFRGVHKGIHPRLPHPAPSHSPEAHPRRLCLDGLGQGGSVSIPGGLPRHNPEGGVGGVVGVGHWMAPLLRLMPGASR